MPISPDAAARPHHRCSTNRLLYGVTPLVIVAAVLALDMRRARADDSSERPSRPNVVLIVVDDLGWADLGCYGSRFHRTPHLDALAARGVRFTEAYAACPVCSPTRAALMTGLFPARLNLTDWLPGRGDRPDQMLRRPVIRQELPLERATIAELLKSAGYATAHLGKWHLGGAGFGPCEQGFDLNIAGDHTGTPRNYFAPYRGGKRGDAAAMPGLESAPDGEYLTDRLAAEAERFIAAHRDEPFFLYLPHYGVHTPMKAPETSVARYPSWDGTPHGKQENPIYAAMLEHVDASIGRITAKLAELNLTDRTLVLFTSDNGGLATTEGPQTPATNNGPLREGKGYLYEGGIRVPLIAAGAGVPLRGATCDVPVWSGDVYPTIAELCGRPLRKQDLDLVDGDDVSSLLRGEAGPRRDALYWHYPHYSNQGGKPGGAVRSGSLKLIEFYESGRRELYDLKADPREGRNLAADRPADVERLAKLLAEWRTAVGAQMPTPNPDYVPNPEAADGTIALPARTAEVHGVQLRYEPLPHKNTLGFWVRTDDYAQWRFTANRGGAFEVELLQGCGTGQGGSEIEIEIAGPDGTRIPALRHTVVDTGHFQNFRAFIIGRVELPQPGRYTLTIRPRTKAKAAVMDVRQVTLRRK